MPKPDEPKGLHDKYVVLKRAEMRASLTGLLSEYGDKHALPYVHPCFVLRYDRDRHARAAMRAYADSCAESEPELAAGLRGLLADCELQANRAVSRAAKRLLDADGEDAAAVAENALREALAQLDAH